MAQVALATVFKKTVNALGACDGFAFRRKVDNQNGLMATFQGNFLKASVIAPEGRNFTFKRIHDWLCNLLFTTVQL